MSIESIGVYSPNTIYGELTRPFVGENEKPVIINSHTEFDEEAVETVLTKDSFYNNQSKMQVSIEDIREMKGLELNEGIVSKVGPEVVQDFSSKNEVPAFQLSTFKNGTGVVFEALKNGYTANNAVVFGKAHEAYANALKLDFTDTVKSLVGTNFKVA
jgi:hypothetical protein